MKESLRASLTDMMGREDPHDTLFGSISDLLSWAGKIPQIGKRRGKGTVWYYNVPAAFDIEFSSAWSQEAKKKRKVGIMYLWSFCLNGGVVQGRTWAEWLEVCRILEEELHLDQDHRLIIFCRNLETEFQYMRGWFEWSGVFAVNLRRPVYAVTKGGIEFRCSYILSGESLATSGKKLRTYKVRKLEGDMDYRLLRHSGTPLTKEEEDYAINDVRVDVAYVQEKMDDVEGLITRLQLTKTGYVRKYCRDACFFGGERGHKKNGWRKKSFQDRMSHLILDPDEYLMLRRAFQGGFTHTSARFSGSTQQNVDSWDLTSSYPASLVAFRYPMSSGEKIQIRNEADFRRNLKLYCCLFDIEFTNLCARDEAPDCFISRSKCWGVRGEVLENNGRVARCDGILCTTITDVDFQIYEKFYSWDSMRIGTFYRYRRGYLPAQLVGAIIDLYEKKTTLKNVPGREQEYTQSKENINSVYGCIVTDICRGENVYDAGIWSMKPPDVPEEIRKYNASERRFLFYPWGVWCTAYSRARLAAAILACGEAHYYYSDTDSVKLVDGEACRPYFEADNARIIAKIRKALIYHGIDPDRAHPKTVKGVEKPLGVWDYEGRYSRFRALRAKAYMTETEDGISITVSGVNKKKAVPYLIKKYRDPFQHFDDGLSIPPEYTGKLTHIYIDEPVEGDIEDYTGKTGHYYEKSGIHMEPAGYDMSLAVQYVEYLRGFREWGK